MDAVVKSVVSGSIAEELGIESGDVLVSVNNNPIKDILDYRFACASEEVLIEIRKKDSTIEQIEIENYDFEDLGMEFEGGLLDKPMACKNKCVFCFIDQLPKGMRKSLYFKDDDYRLSFFMGNYITLTNLSEEDIERIINLHLTRINVSVHTVDAKLRHEMMKNPNTDVLSVMKRFASSGIRMNCQIVLCRNLNDGEKLFESIEKLAELYPYVESVSVVPVGLTKHREGLCKLEGYDADSACEVVEHIEYYQKKFLKDLDTRFVFASDEFYIMANKKMPDFDEYEDFLQIENGVGLISSLNYEFNEALKDVNIPDDVAPKTIATGVSAAPFIKALADKVNKDKINVVAINNDFFGHNITVAGLITAKDIILQLRGKDLGEKILVPECMLNVDGLFLDDLTVSDIERELNTKVVVVENDGKTLLMEMLSGGTNG